MKHNKKRNTAFIYEVLTLELTKAIVQDKAPRKSEIVNILKEYFAAGNILKEELSLYKTIMETKNIDSRVAERILVETKAAYDRLSETDVFAAQSRIISSMNKKLGQEVWANFVPNFKSLASINAIFNDKTPIKKRVLFEQSLVDTMSATPETAKQDVMRPLDNLEYRSFISKFNEKYEGLLQEQKDLLNRFITGFADDGLEMRLFLNEEIGRLKTIISDAKESAEFPFMAEKLEGVYAYLNDIRKREFADEDLHKILKTQELVREMSQND
mgnify:CR=1 FL=1